MTVDDIRLAAIIDCEGWISLEKCNSTGVGIVLTVGVGNTNYRLTDWLKATFGGSVYKRTNRNNRAKDAYVWKVHSSRARTLLEGALPYFLLKRAQAETAIEFQANMHTSRTSRNTCTPEYVAYMESLKRRMGQLNRKGKSISPATTEREDPESLGSDSLNSGGNPERVAEMPTPS